jgi:hypothetical protein
MRARRIFTAQGIAYAYRDRDQTMRRLWVISDNSPDELYQHLEQIRRLLNVDIRKSRLSVDQTTSQSARHAGRKGHYFPKAKVIRTDDRDYLYRAVVDRSAVAATIHSAVIAIDYDNFKSSVPDERRGPWYVDVWFTLEEMQDKLKRPRLTPPGSLSPVSRLSQ